MTTQDPIFIGLQERDEIANTATHGFGFLLSLAAGASLLLQVGHKSTWTIAACDIYVLTLVLLYGSSTLSHAFVRVAWRKRFRTVDQAAIFLLIAGSYTPFGVMYLSHGYWWWLTVGMWSIAILGVCRVVQVGDLSNRDKFAFGAMGLLPIVSFGAVAPQAPAGMLCLLVVGGAFYLLGTIFLSYTATVRYSHACWHLFVVAGSACHYAAVLLAVDQ